MEKEEVIKLKNKLEEINKKLKEHQEKEKSDKETIRSLRELIIDYQEIVGRYDKLLSEERKEHLWTIEKWKESEEKHMKINNEFNEWLREWVKNIKPRLCDDCRKKFEEPWSNKKKSEND